MNIDDIWWVESAEWGQQSAEISEKYKESAKKSNAGIKKTQKDESKAKKYDFMLAKFLVELILKKKYDSLLEKLFPALDAWYGTNFLLGAMSLVYIPISHEIRRSAQKWEIVFQFSLPSKREQFDPYNIPQSLRNRINEWIEDMHTVLSLEASSIIMERTLRLVVYEESIRTFLREVLIFFFSELHYDISEKTAESYWDFILSELEKTLKSLLPELRLSFQQEGLEI